MKVERLQRLEQLLRDDAVNPNGVQFDLTNWGRRSDFKGLYDYTIPLDCGTQACAMGLAALSGAFKAEGLEYRTGVGALISPVLVKDGMVVASDFGAASLLFDIHHATAVLLFDPSFYPATQGAEAELAVADRIHTLIEKGEMGFDGSVFP